MRIKSSVICAVFVLINLWTQLPTDVYRYRWLRINASVSSHDLFTNTDTDFVDATDGPSASIRSIRNGSVNASAEPSTYCPYCIIKIQGLPCPNFEKFENSCADEKNRNGPLLNTFIRFIRISTHHYTSHHKLRTESFCMWISTFSYGIYESFLTYCNRL